MAAAPRLPGRGAFACFCALVLLLGAPADAKADGLIGKGKLGQLVGKGKAGGLLGKGKSGPDILLDLGKGKGKGKGAASYPPAPADWATSVCTGYPFCIPPVIPPTLAPPALSCPPGFNLDGVQCTASQAFCMFGLQMSQGKCCIEKATTSCFATLGPACPGGCTAAGTVCAPSQPYAQVVNLLQVQEAPAPPMELAAGKAYFKLLLPMFDVGKGAVIAGAKAAIESKLIGISTLGKGKGWGKGKGMWTKQEVVPTCFSKCCKTSTEVMCMEPKIKLMTAPVIATCPPGCAGPVGGSCVCDPGGPAPCPPGTKECPSPAGRICASDSLCFGVDQCTIAGLLLPQLKPVTCPVPAARAAPAASAATATTTAKAASAAGGR